MSEIKLSGIKFKTITEMAKEVAEKALDEYEYEGKTIRQWVEILKDYDDKQSTLQEIVKRLEKKIDNKLYNPNWNAGIIAAISIVEHIGGVK